MGQTDATLRAAAGEDLAAVAGSHSLAEAMHLGALALLGLIGTEHLRDTSIFFNNDPAAVRPPILDSKRAAMAQVAAVDWENAARRQCTRYYT